MDEDIKPFITFKSSEDYYNYMTYLPKFYKSLIAEPRPHGMFICTSPPGYPTVATYVYNFTKEEINTQNLSRFIEALDEFNREGNAIYYFQEVHLICTDMSKFFTESNRKVKCLIFELFDNPQLLYYVQAIPFLDLIRTHFNPTSYELLNTYLPFSMKRLKRFADKKGDSRVRALIDVYNNFRL